MLDRSATARRSGRCMRLRVVLEEFCRRSPDPRWVSAAKRPLEIKNPPRLVNHVGQWCSFARSSHPHLRRNHGRRVGEKSFGVTAPFVAAIMMRISAARGTRCRYIHFFTAHWERPTVSAKAWGEIRCARMKSMSFMR